MKKIHTREKRYTYITGRRRRTREKTFRSEEAARVWAEKNGLKGYSVEKLCFGLSKKFKVVRK